MPGTSTLLVFSGAALILLVIPGPAVMYIVARGTSQGRAAALVSVAGIHTGTLVHVLAAVGGLSGLLMTSATAFSVVKLMGAAYLLYVGVRTLLEHRLSESTGPERGRQRLIRVFFDGVLVNVLNPKTALFFLAYVPQFVDPRSGSAAVQLLVLSAVFVLLGLLSDGAYALAAGWVGSRLAVRPTRSRSRQVLEGMTYIGLGVVAAVTGHRTSPARPG